MTAGLVTDASVEHGTLTLNGDGSFVYVPDLDFYGEDSFEYQLVTYPATAINESDPWIDQALVTITVNPVDDDPIVEEIGDQTVVSGDTLTFTVIATDPEGEELTYSLVDNPTGATIDPEMGEFSWDTTDVEPGDYTFDVCVSDGLNTVCETITVTVKAVLDPQPFKLYLPLIVR
jgi:VCBS repeat-containing protein